MRPWVGPPTSAQRTPIDAEKAGGGGKLGAASRLRLIVLVIVPTASTPMAPGYGDGPMKTRAAGMRLPAFASVARIARRRDSASSGWSGVHSTKIGPDQAGSRPYIRLKREAPIGENRSVPGRKSEV